MKFQSGDRIRVLIGVYAGKQGVVDVFASNAPKSVGVRVMDAEKALPVTWFKPEEVEKVG